MEKLQKRDRSGSSDEGESYSLESTAPKKRGRPTKVEKKVELANGGGDSDSPPARGRPLKSAKKGTPTIEATGRGRGRPKQPPSEDENDNGVEEVSSPEEELLVSPKAKGRGKAKNVTPKPKAAKATPKKAGRPKKPANSDDDDYSDDDKQEERRPVGRPGAGAINLNIERTGRGPGRPKKPVSTGRRGRPALGTRTPYVPTGRPRGRPKANSKPVASVDDDDECDQDDESVDDPKVVDIDATEDDDGADQQAEELSDEEITA